MKTNRFIQLLSFAVILPGAMALGAEHFINGDGEGVPCWLWAAGCTPTAASMVIGF